jgi:hypothetical protein
MRDPTPPNEMAAPCPDFEEPILACFDQALSGPERQKVDDHLRACPACLSFWNEQEQLDVLLRSAYARPALAPAFKHELLQRVKAELVQAGEGSLAAPSQELESFALSLRKALRRRVAFALLDLAGYAAIALAVGLVGRALLARIPAWDIPVPRNLEVYAAWGSAAAVCLWVGLWFSRMASSRARAHWH